MQAAGGYRQASDEKTNFHLTQSRHRRDARAPRRRRPKRSPFATSACLYAHRRAAGYFFSGGNAGANDSLMRPSLRKVSKISFLFPAHMFAAGVARSPFFLCEWVCERRLRRHNHLCIFPPGWELSRVHIARRARKRIFGLPSAAALFRTVRDAISLDIFKLTFFASPLRGWYGIFRKWVWTAKDLFLTARGVMSVRGPN